MSTLLYTGSGMVTWPAPNIIGRPGWLLHMRAKLCSSLVKPDPSAAASMQLTPTHAQIEMQHCTAAAQTLVAETHHDIDGALLLQWADNK